MTQMPLDIWRTTMGYDPQHFWGLAGPRAPVLSECNGLVYEYAWQAAMAAGRADIRRAIGTAEEKMRQYLGYRVSPGYAEVTLPYPRTADVRLRQVGIDARWHYLSVQLQEGYIQAIGAEVPTSLGTTTLPIALNDLDSDGIPDQFVATLAVATTATEIVPMFAAADRYDGSGIGSRWEVSPVQVANNGTQVVISGPAWLIVRPVLYQGRRPAGLDAANIAPGVVYASALEFVSRTTDATQAGYVRWEQEPWPGGICCSYGPGTQAFTAAELRDAERGIVAPVFPGSCGWAWWGGYCRPPDTITLRYRAGYNRPEEWYPWVSRLAAAELSQPICACQAMNQELYKWQVDYSRTSGNADDLYNVGTSINNPLGVQRGHVETWKQIVNRRQTRGILV